MSKTFTARPRQYLRLLEVKLRSFELMLECKSFDIDVMTFLHQSFNQLLEVVVKVDTKDRQSLMLKILQLEPSGLLDDTRSRDELKGTILEVKTLLASLSELETATQTYDDAFGQSLEKALAQKQSSGIPVASSQGIPAQSQVSVSPVDRKLTEDGNTISSTGRSDKEENLSEESEGFYVVPNTSKEASPSISGKQADFTAEQPYRGTQETIDKAAHRVSTTGVSQHTSVGLDTSRASASQKTQQIQTEPEDGPDINTTGEEKEEINPSHSSRSSLGTPSHILPNTSS